MGASGVGKTTLAAEYAREVGGVVVDCFGVADAQTMVERIREAVAARGAASLEAASEQLGVLVLDDVLPEADISEIRTRFAGPVLVTAHEKPVGAAQLPVQPFRVPERDQFVGSAAHRLFEEVAKHHRLDWDEGDEVDSIWQLARRTEGFPLGLAIVARHAATIGCQEVMKLESSRVSDVGRVDRHQSLATALGFTMERLSPSDRLLLFTMTLFRRPLSVTLLAETVGVPIGELLVGIERLAASGLVVAGAYPRPIESMYEFAGDLLNRCDPGALAKVKHRIVQAAVRLAPEPETGFAPAVESDEGPSFWEAALDIGIDDHDACVRVATAMLHWCTEFSPAAGSRIAWMPLIEDLDDTQVWQGWGRLSRLRTDHEAALRAFERASQAAVRPEDSYFSELQRATTLSLLERLDEALAVFDSLDRFGIEEPARYVTEALLRINRNELDEAAARIETFMQFGERPPRLEYVARQLNVQLTERGERARQAAALVRLTEQMAVPRRMARAYYMAAQVQEFDAGNEDEARRLRDLAREHAATAGYEAVLQQLLADEAMARYFAGDQTLAFETAARLDPAALRDDTYRNQIWLLRALAAVESREFARARANLDEMIPVQWYPPFDRLLDVARTIVALESGDGPRGTSPGSEALARIFERHDAPFDEQVELYVDCYLPIASDPAADFRLAAIWALRGAPQGFRRLRELEEVEADVVFTRDFEAMRVGGEWRTLKPQFAVISRLLCENDIADFEAIAEGLWPDDKVGWESVVNRINVQMSGLRKAGLRPYLNKEPDGFVLDADVFVEPELSE